MNRFNVEARLIQTIHDLPDDKLFELLDFVTLLKDRLSPEKQTFVEFIRQSPLYDVELEIERDQSICRTLEL